MADLIFAFDAALDRPLVVSEDAPPAVAEAISRAPAEAFAAAVAAARGRAAALVLCGRVLDASRASPAQGAMLRRAVIDLAAAGCRTIVVAESTGACHDLARLLGEPAGLGFVTPLSPLELDVRGARVEIVSAHGPLAASPVDQPGERAAVRRRIIVGSDRAGWQSGRWQDAAGEPDPFSVGPHGAAWAIPGATWVWGTRGAQPLPPGVEPLPPLQARSDREPRPGACLGLVLTDRAAEEIGPGDSWQAAAPRIDWRGGWREFPTHRVSWRTIAVDSPAGGDEELATTIWAALERLTPTADGPLEVVRCAVACGTSVARRVRVAEISAETLALVRKLGDPAAFRIWLCEVYADPTESLAALGHARSGGRPGTTTSFASALADIVVSLEHAAAPPVPGDLAREAGWLALELLESP